MSSMKLEPTEEEAPLNGTQAVSILPPAHLPTVKCELTLSESYICADGKCDDCQTAADKEDEKDDTNLTMTLTAAPLPLSRPENDESEFHPPIWEDCEAAEETGNASGEEMKEESSDNVEEGNAREVPEKETRQMAVNVGSSPIAFCPSTRALEVEEMMVEGESEVNSNPPSSMLSQAIPEQRNDEVIVSYEGNRSARTEPEEEEEEAGPAEATCGAAFNQKGTLKILQRTHTVERPYACGICLKSFKSESSLAQHTLTHSGFKPFTCADCGLSFALKGNLERHRKGKSACASRYAPSKRRPFTCMVEGCGKAFKEKHALNVHIRVHSGAKEFKCTVCGEAFTTKASLKRHRHKYHGI